MEMNLITRADLEDGAAPQEAKVAQRKSKKRSCVRLAPRRAFAANAEHDH